MPGRGTMAGRFGHGPPGEFGYPAARMEGAPGGEAAEHRLAAGCAAGMALASAGTWLRVALTHSARIETGGWPFIAASAVAGAGIIVAGICSLRLAPRAHRLSWRALWGWALAVQAVSF